jgi:cobalt-zinc-cadmium efflux system protein
MSKKQHHEPDHDHHHHGNEHHHNHEHYHNHAHDHPHGHSDIFHTHAPANKMKQAFFLAIIILAAELIFGFLSNSLALLADAWHMATDVAAIGLAWFAIEQAKKNANQKMTFGYERAGILAAAVNGLTLIAITLWILWSAVGRIIHPEEVSSWGMFVGAGIGVVVNLVIIFALRGDSENLNVKAALLHVIGDLGASVGVIIAGLIIVFTGWTIVDPILSVGIALLVGYGAWKICKQTFDILMEATPNSVNTARAVEAMQSVDGVLSVHDLHVWCITSGKNALSCHIVLSSGISFEESQGILQTLEMKIKGLGIGHVTLQLEDLSHKHDNSLLCKMSGSHLH